MKILQNLLEALESLSANKVRSMLTVLGIVIGVAAVIAMLSIGNGASAAITNQIESIGTNLVYITPGATRQNGVTQASGTAGTLTLDDAKAVESVSGVVAESPIVNGFAQAVYMGNNTNTRVLGVMPTYIDVANITLADGTFITDSNQAGRSLVAILGSSVAEDLFGSTSGVVGQKVRLNGQTYKIIGVLASKGGTGFMNQDDQIIIPLSTAQTRLVGNTRFRGASTIQQILVKITDAKLSTQVEADLTTLLRERHGTIEGSDDFSISSQQDTLDAMTTVTNTLSLFLGGIAGISLLVGGIGIMNIMLTTVSERTREIGLRKAIGARRSDILMQFLVESMLLSIIGGILGIALGWGISRLIGQVQWSGSTIIPVVGLDSILLATLFSMAVGLFFGIYPATRAARLQPVEALRYE